MRKQKLATSDEINSGGMAKTGFSLSFGLPRSNKGLRRKTAMTERDNRLAPVNVYGDHLDVPMGDWGCDISSQRLDDLDKQCITHAMQLADGARGVDLGSGHGVPSFICALAGVRMTLFDVLPLDGYFAELAKFFPILPERLVFVEADLGRISPEMMPHNLDFIYSQRFVHYLRFGDAQQLLLHATANLKPGGLLFLSASGLDSELGDGYEGKNFKPADRFHPLAPNTAKKHSILSDVCLYTTKDMCDLVIPLGLEPISVTKSAFGNVKGTFRKV